MITAKSRSFAHSFKVEYLWVSSSRSLILPFIPHAVSWYTGTSEKKRKERMWVSMEEFKKLPHSYTHTEVAGLLTLHMGGS